jgi:hypothetical protein
MKTIKETIAAIRAADMSGRWSPEFGEWRITFPQKDMPDAERREAVAYYTPDNDDALSSAQVMRERFERTNPPVWQVLNHIGG